MSAFMVDDKTINTVVAFLKQEAEESYGCNQPISDVYDLCIVDGCRDLANAMFALNIQGVESRYGKGQAVDFRPMDFEYIPMIPGSAAAAYRAMNVLLYQCAEGDVVEASLYVKLQKVNDAIAHKLAHVATEHLEHVPAARRDARAAIAKAKGE